MTYLIRENLFINGLLPLLHSLHFLLLSEESWAYH